MERQNLCLGMTDKQYELLDELYFIQTAETLHARLGWTKAEVAKVLLEIFENGWLKVLFKHDQEIELTQQELALQINEYGFIASKTGLFAHNSN